MSLPPEILAFTRKAMRAFHDKLDRSLDRCPDHNSVRMIMACARCSSTLHAQLDRRRALDAKEVR